LSSQPEFYSIVVPVFNALSYLKTTVPVLQAIVAQSPAAELILVDNGSTDGSWEYLQGLSLPNVKILQVPDVKVGEVRNAGARVARGSTLVFVDSDCLLPDDYLHTVESAFAESSAVAVGSYYSMSPDPNWLERAWHTLHSPAADGFTAWVPAGNLAVLKEVFNSIGGFRRDLSSGEDVELCARLHAKGTPVYQSRGIVSHHLGNAREVREFVRKHAWHGEGMLATGSRSWLSRPLLMTLAHWIIVALAVAGVVLTGSTWPEATLIIFLAAMLIPFATVVYRGTQKRRAINPVTGSIAYFLYYLARGVSLKRLISPSRRR
jgi:glycosyltransferase involved in cell wall biosynthesis